MSIFEASRIAMENNDADAWCNLLHEDYVFVSHQDGTTKNKSEMTEMITMMTASDTMSQHDVRCVYENDEVVVDHAVMDFPDGTSEAVLACHTLKDGKIIRTETGATLLKK